MSDSDNSKQAADPSVNGHAGADKSMSHTPGEVESITRNASGQLVVRLKGQEEPLVDAKVARCFPWSMPEVYVSVRNKEGKEVALLKTLDEIDATSREVVREELHDKILNPKITKILEHKNEFGITSIKAETDRGEVTFQIRSRDDIRILSSTRLLFRDADGNTYEVVDLNAMDAGSRKFLETYF